jgi:ribose transport system ATP-binding protein
VLLDGRQVRLRTPRDAMRAGLALVPEDRKTEGLLLGMSMRDNMTLAVLRRLCAGGVIRRGAERSLAQEMMQRLKVRAAGPAVPVGTLSGGNQQKVLLGKWLCGEPKLLLLHEPTQGVDVGAREDLEESIRRAAANGAGVILAGMDASELACLCDRVLVMREGRVGLELCGGLTPERIIDAVYRDGRGRTPE